MLSPRIPSVGIRAPLLFRLPAAVTASAERSVSMSVPLGASMRDADCGELRTVLQGCSLLMVAGPVDGAGGVKGV